MENKNNLKEVKIYLDADMKERLQAIASEQGKPFRTFIVDTLVQVYDTAYLEKELLRLKRESSLFMSKIKSIKID